MIKSSPLSFIDKGHVTNTFIGRCCYYFTKRCIGKRIINIQCQSAVFIFTGSHSLYVYKQVMKSPCSRKSKLAGCIKKCRMGFFQYLFCILNIQILQETLRSCSRPLAKHPLEMEGAHIDMFCDLLQFRLRTIVLFNKADSICNPIIIQFLL